MTNKAEFHSALEYIKKDVICGTESCLEGLYPGKDPPANAIKPIEAFPDTVKVHRNDRSGGPGGGVFITTSANITSDDQPQLTTELIWNRW